MDEMGELGLIMSRVELIRACRLGDITEARRLIGLIDVDFTTETRDGIVSPISLACEHGHLELAELLIVNGANVNDDSISQPIIITAIMNRNLAMIRMLLDNNVDIELDNHNHGTALQNACYWGYDEIVDFLIMNGADINVRNSRGWTLLHVAVDRWRTDVIKTLLKHGIDKNALTLGGKKAIEFSCSEEITNLLSDEIDIKEPECD